MIKRFDGKKGLREGKPEAAPREEGQHGPKKDDERAKQLLKDRKLKETQAQGFDENSGKDRMHPGHFPR